MKNNLFFLIFMSLFFFQCKSNQYLTKNESCFNKKLDFVIENDLSNLIYSKEELILVLKFYSQNNNFKVAVFPKTSFSKYRLGKTKDKILGYFPHGNIKVFVFGESYPKFLNLRQVEQDMVYLNELPVKEPKEGFPPLPPHIVEPSIYSYEKGTIENCYILLSKKINDTLLE